jgi:type IV pilus assembly protein PilW
VIEARHPASAPSHQRGLGLVETLTALAIGLFLIAVALTLHARTNSTLRTLDAHARMHETARHALAVIESDVRMAGYWGLANGPQNVATHPTFAFPARCGGSTWITSITRPIDGTNNRYLTVANCTASGGGARAGADVLVVRRASARAIPLTSATVPSALRDEVLLVSTRERAQLFVAQATGNAIPAGFPITASTGLPPRSELREVLVHAYYVSADSSLGTGIPALRRKLLVGGPNVSDEELAIGVDDLQFRIGADVDGDGVLDSYFEPETVPATAQPICVRVWLRVRGIERTGAAAALATTSYADRSWPAIRDGFDRLLVSKTIRLRNSTP